MGLMIGLLSFFFPFVLRQLVFSWGFDFWLARVTLHSYYCQVRGTGACHRG